MHRVVNGVRVELTEAEIVVRLAEEAAWAEDRRLNRYKDQRSAAYAAEMPIADQLEALLEGGKRLDDIKTKYAEIKGRFPKPE